MPVKSQVQFYHNTFLIRFRLRYKYSSQRKVTLRVSLKRGQGKGNSVSPSFNVYFYMQSSQCSVYVCMHLGATWPTREALTFQCASTQMNFEQDRIKMLDVKLLYMDMQHVDTLSTPMLFNHCTCSIEFSIDSCLKKKLFRNNSIGTNPCK